MTTVISKRGRSQQMRDRADYHTSGPVAGRRNGLLGRRVETAFGTVVFPALLGLFITRGELFARGPIEYTADFATSLSHASEWANWATSWNPAFGMSNASILSQAPPNWLLLSLFNTATAEKLFLLAAYMLMASAMFATARWWLRRQDAAITRTFLVALLVAFVFTVNGWVTVESVHVYYLWMYALLPLAFRLAVSALESDRAVPASVFAGLCGVVGVASFTAYGIAFDGIFLGILALAWIIHRRTDLWARLRRAVLVLGSFVCAVFLSSMYWLLPIEFGFHANFSNGTSWAVFTSQDMFTLSPYTPIVDTVRGMYAHVTSALDLAAVGHSLQSVGSLLMFVLVGLAVFKMVIGGRHWTVLGLTLSAIIFVLLANGTNAPVGPAYARLAALPGFRSIAYVVFKGPYKLVPEALFCIVMLSAATLRQLWALTRWQKGAAVLASAGLVFGCAVVGSPLMTGNLAGYMKPITPPRAYVQALAHVATLQKTEGGSAVWLPLNTNGTVHPAWAPKHPALPLISGMLTPEGSWLLPAPLSSRGTTWLAPAPGRLFDQLIATTLAKDPSANIGTLLASGGRGSVDVRLDASEDPVAVAQSLSRAKGLRLVATNRWLRSYVPTSGSVVRPVSLAIAVGGLDQLVVDSTRGAASAVQRPIVFATNIGPRDLSSVLADASEIDFSPGQDWSSLALDTWNGPGATISLAGLVHQTTPLSAWTKNAFNSNTWLPVYLAGMQGQLFSQSISPTFLQTGTSATLDVPVCSANRSQSVWVRRFVSPLGDTLSAQVQGSGVVKSLSDFAPTVLGWQWAKVTTLPAGSGCGHMRLSVTGQLSALDELVLAPRGSVTARSAALEQDASGRNIAVGGYWSGFKSSDVAHRVAAASPIAVEMRSGTLESRNPGSPSFPVTITARSNAASHFAAVALDFAPVDMNGYSEMQVRLGTGGTFPLSDIQDVMLTNTRGVTLSYLPFIGAGTLTLYLPSPVNMSWGRRSSVDLSHIDRMTIETSAVIPSDRLLRLTVKSMDGLSPNATKRTVTIPVQGSYRIEVRGVPASMRATVDGHDVTFTSQSGWAESSPIVLPRRTIAVSVAAPLPSDAVVELFRSVGGGTWANDDHVSGLAGGRNQIRVSRTAYNPGWQLQNVPTAVHLVINGFENGYLAPHISGREVFAPNKWLAPGRALSAMAVVGLCAGAVFVLTIERRRRRVSP